VHHPSWTALLITGKTYNFLCETHSLEFRNSILFGVFLLLVVRRSSIGSLLFPSVQDLIDLGVVTEIGIDQVKKVFCNDEKR